MSMTVWNYQCCVSHSPVFVKGPEKCGIWFTWPWEEKVSFHLKQAFLNRFGEANYVLSNWQNQPSKKCMVFSNPECMTLPANILNVIMWVRSWSISLKIGTCGCSSLSLLMYQNRKWKLSSAGCPSWEARGFIFSDTQLFIAASANAGGFVDVAPIRKQSHFTIRLDLPLCLSLHGCRARVACASPAWRAAVFWVWESVWSLCVRVCERGFQGAAGVLGKRGASPSPSAVCH